MTTLLPFPPLLSFDIASSENETLARFLGLVQEEDRFAVDFGAVDVDADADDVLGTVTLMLMSPVASFGLWSAIFELMANTWGHQK